jgi:lysophospholipase L1-like esterase
VNISRRLLKIFVPVGSLVVTLAVGILVYEIAERYRYDAWREGFLGSIEWYGGLTVASKNEVLIYEYRPNFEGKLGGTPIRTNAFGFRDVERTVQKDSETARRYAFIGDSVTLGLKAEFNKIFTRRLEEMQKRIRIMPHSEYLNFSVDGYDVLQIREMLKTKVLTFRPDVVIYVISLNDFNFRSGDGGKKHFFKQPTSFFLRKVDRVLTNLVGFYEYNFWKNERHFWQAVDEMHRVLTEADLEFVAVIMPVLSTDSTEYPYSHFHKSISQKLSERNIDSLDLYAALYSGPGAPRKNFEDVWHLSEQGHACVTSVIDEYLQSTAKGVQTSPTVN